MKEKNLGVAQETVKLLEHRRRQLEYCEDSDTRMEFNLYKDGKGSVNIGYVVVPPESQHILKLIIGAEIRKQINELETALEKL